MEKKSPMNEMKWVKVEEEEEEEVLEIEIHLKISVDKTHSLKVTNQC